MGMAERLAREMPTNERPDITLEQLLVALGLVSAKDLNDLNLQSGKTGLPLGRTLVISRLISEQNLERLLKLQAINRGRKLPFHFLLGGEIFALWSLNDA